MNPVLAISLWTTVRTDGKEDDHSRDRTLDLALLFREMDCDYLGQAGRVVHSALAYAALSSWIKHEVMTNGSRLRRARKSLFGPGTSRGVDA